MTAPVTPALDGSRFTALIAKLEAASQGSRELDSLIFRAIDTTTPDADWHDFGDVWGRRDPDDPIAFDLPPAYTTSLDAARKLVQAGAVFTIMTDYELPGRAHIYAVNVGHDGYSVQADAATPELALCIAALKALSTIEAARG